MKRISIALLSVVALAAALPAAAQSDWRSSVYVGGALGQAKAKDACSGIPGCDDKDTTWGLFAGYQFNRNFAAEFGYHDLGSVSAPGVSVDSTAWELVGVGMLPLTNQFSAYGKLGGYRGKVEGGGVSKTSTELTYGLGLQYDMTRNVGLRGEWQRYPNVGDSDTDVDVLRVAAIFRFQ